MNNKITIIILIFEENLNEILKCIESVKNFKIIIVDNSGNSLNTLLVQDANYDLLKN